MRVLEAISDTNIGGAGKLLLTRLRNSDRERITTAVVLPLGSMLTDRFESIGIKCYTVEGCADKSFDIGAIKKLSSVIKDFEPDIVNAHGCMSARIASLLCRVPVRIYTRHCAFESPAFIKSFPVRQCVGTLSRVISTDVIAVADAAANDLVDMGIPRKKINVIINGVDGLRKYTEEERKACRAELSLDGCFAVGICARLEECKDHVSFLRAARVLALKDERYRFLIIGDGSQRKYLEELTLALGITDKVIFTGFTDDVEMYFNCLDLNVNCSVGTETSSLALSEGMSIGLPTVASSFGGNPYMVRDGENGYIYEASDFVSLACKIEKIANDRELYEHMSKRAFERYKEELNAKKMTEETEALYLALGEQKGRDSRRARVSKLG